MFQKSLATKQTATAFAKRTADLQKVLGSRKFKSSPATQEEAERTLFKKK
ncbi:hypothetical protein [Paenibacillus sp. MMO-177]